MRHCFTFEVEDGEARRSSTSHCHREVIRSLPLVTLGISRQLVSGVILRRDRNQVVVPETQQSDVLKNSFNRKVFQVKGMVDADILSGYIDVSCIECDHVGVSILNEAHTIANTAKYIQHLPCWP